MPMKLDEGWNQIQFNLSDFTRRAYGTNYIETLRISIHANCRIRRVYFSERLYNEEDLPDDFKLFAPQNVKGGGVPRGKLTGAAPVESEKNENNMNMVNSENTGKENYYQQDEDEIREFKQQQVSG